MKRVRLLFLAIVFTGLNSAFGAPVQQWFDTGNQHYANQQFDSALTWYEKIIDEGTTSSDVYFNIGNCYYRQKQLGLARLYFEKARRISPNDPDIQTNIRFVVSNMIDKIPEPERGFFGSVLWKLHTLFSLVAQLWILFGVLCFLSLFIVLSVYNKGNGRLWFIYLSVLTTLLFFIFTGSVSIKIYDSEKVHYAVLLSPSADAKNQPDGKSILFTIHEGSKLRIRKTINDWSLISLPNGYSGWIENSDFGRI